LDLYSRRVVSWAFSSHPNTELSANALQRALADRKPEPPPIFHTDQGVQYSSNQFQRLLRTHGITASMRMSMRGNCLDNAVTERFFRSARSILKCNRLHFDITAYLNQSKYSQG
jgi:putative transposase